VGHEGVGASAVATVGLGISSEKAAEISPNPGRMKKPIVPLMVTKFAPTTAEFPNRIDLTSPLVVATPNRLS
jgi:hypothetical protein